MIGGLNNAFKAVAWIVVFLGCVEILGIISFLVIRMIDGSAMNDLNGADFFAGAFFIGMLVFLAIALIFLVGAIVFLGIPLLIGVIKNSWDTAVKDAWAEKYGFKPMVKKEKK